MPASGQHTAAVTALLGVTIGSVATLAMRRWMKVKVKDPPRDGFGSTPSADGKNKSSTKRGFSAKSIPADDIDVIVIGSGMGGLTAAALLAKEGKRVLVLEQHDTAGGNTHTFDEKGFEFDTGLHYVGGKVGNKGSMLRQQIDYITDGEVEWERMDDVYDVAIAPSSSGGREERHNFCSDWRILKKELKLAFPEDGEAIDRYFYLVRKVFFLLPVFFLLRMLPRPVFAFSLWVFDSQLWLFKKTTREVLETITENRRLIGVLSYSYGDYGEVPSRGVFFMNALIRLHYEDGAYYPVGGPSRIAEAATRAIERRGGRVLVRAPVSSILVDDGGSAVGVEVRGRRIHAPLVISSVGAPLTYARLIPTTNRYLVKDRIRAMDDPRVASDMSLMSLFVGLDDSDGRLDLPKRNFWIFPSWDHEKNYRDYREDATAVPALFISFSSAKDPTYVARHPGRQVALVIGPCVYADVEAYRNDRVKHRGDAYVEMKRAWEKILLAALVDHFPQLRGRIEFAELGTAVTNDFYLGTHRGAVYGLAHTPERFSQQWLTPKTPVKGLFLSGQDVACCGINGALAGGYMCAYTISTRCMLRTLWGHVKCLFFMVTIGVDGKKW